MTAPGRTPGFNADEEAAIGVEVKRALRVRLRAVRRALPADARAARSAAIVASVQTLPEWRGARTVASYVPILGEADPTALAGAVGAAGGLLALPRVDAAAGTITLRAWSPGEPLERGGFGVMEPLSSAPEVPASAVDFVLVPALAVDLQGNRLGYGKGLYDRLLPTLPTALRCALAYDFQLVSELPSSPTDAPVDVVVTDARVLRVESRDGRTGGIS